MKCIECEKELTLTDSIYKLSADVYCSLKCLWKNAKRQTVFNIEKCTLKKAKEDESVRDVQEALFSSYNK